jgi:glutathione S-transferase
MLRVWGRPNSVNVQKVMWCIAELGVAHERRNAGLEYGENHTPWFLAKNPNGTIPLLEDGTFSLWESNTIVRYLAAKYDFGGLYPEALQERANAERWMDWQLSLLLEPVTVVFKNLIRRPAGERDMAAVARAIGVANELLERLDAHLEHRPYVAGPRFTMGDIPVGALTHRWLALEGIERPALTHIRRWYQALAGRPAYRDHVMLPLS